MIQRGDTLGSWLVIGELGQGGLGMVWLVRHLHLDMQCALKQARSISSRAQVRLLREARIQSGLEHDNLVRVRDVITAPDGTLCLIMDYVKGRDLATLLVEERIPWELALRIFRDVLSGVSAAHEAGVVHRDLKPGNVLVSGWPDQVRALVTDFGLGKQLDQELAITTSSGLLGTAPYMAPEQVEFPARVDIRADIFSLGCILYEILTGERAFPGGDIVDILDRIREGIWERRDGPPAICAALEGCLATEPTRRIPNIHVLQAVLEGRRTWHPGEGRPELRWPPQSVQDGRTVRHIPRRTRVLVMFFALTLLVYLFAPLRWPFTGPSASDDAGALPPGMHYRPTQGDWVVSGDDNKVYRLPTAENATECAYRQLKLAVSLISEYEKTAGTVPPDLASTSLGVGLGGCVQALALRYPADDEGGVVSALVTAGCARGRRFIADKDGQVSEVGQIAKEEIPLWFTRSGVVLGRGLGQEDVWSHAPEPPDCSDEASAPRAYVSYEVSCALDALQQAEAAEAVTMAGTMRFEVDLSKVGYVTPHGCESAIRLRVAAIPAPDMLLEAVICQGEDTGRRFFESFGSSPVPYEGAPVQDCPGAFPAVTERVAGPG